MNVLKTGKAGQTEAQDNADLPMMIHRANNAINRVSIAAETAEAIGGRAYGPRAPAANEKASLNTVSSGSVAEIFSTLDVLDRQIDRLEEALHRLNQIA